MRNIKTSKTWFRSIVSFGLLTWGITLVLVYLLLILFSSFLSFRLYGQTVINGGRTILGNVDFSNSPVTRVIKTGTSLPPTCTVGDLYFKSDATAGGNIYGCTSTNIWTPQAGGGGGSVAWGSITGTLSLQTDLNSALGARELTANKNSSSGYAGLTGGTKLIKTQGDEIWGLVDLTDVTGTHGSGSTIPKGTFTSLSIGHLMTWDGANWINQAPAGASVAWGSITGTLSNQTDLNSVLSGKESTSNKNSASGYAGLTAGIKLTKTQGDEVWGLADLTDVTGTSGAGTTVPKGTFTGLTTGDNLTWNGTNWVNQAAAGGAPSSASYITKVAEAGLSGEFALGTLSTGMLKVTTATGDLSIALASDLPAHATRHQHGGNDEIASSTAGANVIAKADGTGTLNVNWLPSSGVAAGTYGSGSLVPVITVDARGRLTTVSTAAVTFGGAASGDLSGTYPSPQVAGIRGSSVSTTAPAAGQKLAWSTSSGEYQPTREWLNCKLYGATGNGTSDDTAAIQGCIDALPAVGGMVFLPRGRYRITAPLVLGDATYSVHSTKHNIRIIGEGRGVMGGVSGDSATRGTTEIFYDGSTTYSGGTGTISATKNERYIYGSGTSFRTQLKVGGKIIVGSVTRTVVGISTDTEMYVDIPVLDTFASQSFTYLNAPMISILGPQIGSGVSNLRLNGNGKATGGIAVINLTNGQFADFAIDSFTGAGLIFTSSVAAGVYYGCNSTITGFDINANGSTFLQYSGSGIVMDGMHTNQSDTCSNKFYWGAVSHGGGASSAGVVIGFTDNNRFDHVQIGAQGTDYWPWFKSYASTDELETWGDANYSSTTPHGLQIGDIVRLSNSSGSMPSPLTAGIDYYVTAVTSSTRFKVGVKSPTLDTGTDVFSLTSHGLFNGQAVRFTGSFYGGMGTGDTTWYFVRDVASNTFKVAHRQGGPAVDFFSTGSVSIAGLYDTVAGLATINITTDNGGIGNVLRITNVSGGASVYFDRTKANSGFPKGNQFTEFFFASMAGVSGTGGNSFLQIPSGEGVSPIMLENIYNITERGAGAYGSIFGEYPHTLDTDVGFYVNNSNGGTNGASGIEWRRQGVPVASFHASLDYGAKIQTYRGGPLADSVFFDMDGGMRLVGVSFSTLNSLAPANGTMMYCTDCNPTVASCTGSSNGSIARRLAGAWRCD